MRRGIVLKLFILTAALCMLILATIFIGQTIFFKKYYENRKVNNIQTNMTSFEKAYLSNHNTEAIQKLEQDFYRENNTWITTLDRYGNLRGLNDFYLEVKLDRASQNELGKATVTIPLYNLLNIDEIEHEEIFRKPGTKVSLFGIEKDDTFIPSSITMANGSLNWTNKTLNKKMNEINLEIKKGNKKKSEVPYTSFTGSVVKLQFPDKTAGGNTIYKNNLFMESIREFQTDLLLNENQQTQDSLQINDYEKNDIKYKLLIKPIKEKDGSLTYIFAMASLQPVDEAVQMVKDYYVYLIAFVLVLIFLASFYYSKQIAKPLLRINDTTKKIARLDFSEKIPITSKDEIGDLSQNINMLSNTLHSHIEQLEQDIEKERKLENTRKEFISGVSHELKTPLSIMKSCISILKDGVAEHKKEYYFQAMEKEVDKMDILILDMLELAKFESGTYNMKMDSFYIDEMIEEICEQLSSEIEKKELHVYKYVYSAEVIANQNRIEQVIVNFITNAIRYTPEKEDIIISTIDEQNCIKVCIENKGAHIEEEQIDKIWERFYRIDTARQRSQGGTGLGLAISKNILELHKVEYGVTNTVDGVLFYFYLRKKV
ncbi:MULTISPECIES: cell wall metabolism sensor histidine kinase WalK [unclassified Bacillus (in: firmicutes)]|uniref:sensor histidine kinase n=1 Tax=unclassified Bacillus (in: firmicutes) TaxID=185979 RepID=UPI0008E9C0F9|nr:MULTISPECIES: sensor histidine kinase [unclassified Bacillus (in: firmicutes)]SFI25345.1 Signal transduction histidine kinase [Bacillus sp. 71mf]SFS41030.1 Signal transduction histidine kinase [Bacillus sp. 103mf]